MISAEAAMIATIAEREKYRDWYQNRRDPIRDDRLLWRAQTVRHMTHLLPGQSILELGCGEGRLTQRLWQVSRGQCPITAVTFAPAAAPPPAIPTGVEFRSITALPGDLAHRTFDVVVGIDLLDQRNSAWLLQRVYDLLAPGGQFIFYESNPWNPVLQLRRRCASLVRRSDPRKLLSRPRLYELVSEIGFVRCFAVYNDFAYRPLSRLLHRAVRGASVLLENAPLLRRLAGAILLHAQRPPRVVAKPAASLFEHEALRGAVSVVIPCHNEEANVEPLVARLRELFGEYLHQIVLVDDNSADGTTAAIRRLAAADPVVVPVFRHPPCGVGRALADGFAAATGRWVLSMDCDFLHLLPEMRDLMDAAARGHDVVLGSRFSRHSVLLNYPFTKIVANRVFHLIANIVLRRRCRDLTNNLKLMRRRVVDHLQLTEPGFAVNAETGLQPLLMGCDIAEVPISWINRTPDMGTSSFRLLRAGTGYWRVLFGLWRRTMLHSGPYRPLAQLGSTRGTSRGDGLPPKPRPGGAT